MSAANVYRKIDHPSGMGLRSYLGPFLKHPKHVASVIPSSRSLCRQLQRLPCLTSARCVVELGPGNGGTTEAILSAIPPIAPVLCIELLAELVRQLGRLSDSRLRIVHGHAVRVEEFLGENELPHPDVVISGVPFSTLSPGESHLLIARIYSCLAPGGTFVAYQFRDHVRAFANPLFGEPQISRVFWNVPPLRVYQWTKRPATLVRKIKMNNSGSSEVFERGSEPWATS